MSRASLRLPKYRHHKGSGQAFVQVKGRRHYLGKYGCEESRQRYRQFVAEVVSSPPAAVPAMEGPGKGLLIVELAAAYWEFAQGYYLKNGEPTAHLCLVRTPLRTLRELYGRTRARGHLPFLSRNRRQGPHQFTWAG